MLLRPTHIYAASVFLLLCVQGCQKKSFPADYRGRVIELGHGGGFTGIETRYQLMEDGRLFGSSSHDTLPKQLGKEKPRLVRRWFDSYDSLHLDQVDFHKPGNTYRYIKAGDRRVTWSSSDMPEARINAFYQQFVQHWIGKSDR